ncbi:MAG: SMP-30/gluconolactonase/LRE family protein [Parvularculaceae bacterium]
MKRIFLMIVAVGAVAACAKRAETDAAPLHQWAFEDAEVFPADQSLLRAEDGVILADGRVVVADQAHGLRAISPNGDSRPFGRFDEAGYCHEPPAFVAGPNGVSFEPDRAHILVADVYTGAVWRVDVEDETVTRVYQHEFGVNSAEADTTGAIWFTQSTQNSGGADTEARMFAAIDRPMGDGALYRIGPSGTQAALVAAGFNYANGVAVDEKRGAVYLAETMGDRVIGYRADFKSGAVSDRHIVAEVLTPDNLKLDEEGGLWVASPLANEILVVNPDSGKSRSVFRAATPENDQIAAEWRRRVTAGEPALELFTPSTWAPLPGALTSVILAPGDGPIYVGTLGNALLKLERQP